MRLVRINQLSGKRRIFTAKSTAALLSSVLSSSNDAATALLDGNNGQVDVGRQAEVQFDSALAQSEPACGGRTVNKRKTNCLRTLYSKSPASSTYDVCVCLSSMSLTG
jgi:hypothetical protein